MRLSIVILACCIVNAGRVDGQAHGSSVRAVEATVGDPTAAGTRSVGPGLLAVLSSKDKVAAGTLGTSFGASDRGEWNPWVKGSGPVDENDATAQVVLADLSGMRGSAKVGVGLNYLRWSWKSDVEAERAVCRRVFADPAIAPDSIRKVIQEALKAVDLARRETVRDSLLDFLVTKVCSRHRLPQGVRREFDSAGDYGTVYLAGMSGEYARSKFKYADTIAAQFRSRTDETWAATVGAAVYLPNERILFSGTLRFERSLEAGTPRQYCIPVGITGATQCRTLALVGPEASSPVLLTGETRWFLSEQTGLSPRVTVDLAGKRGVGVELPILLRQQTDKGFTSAFALGWRSKPSSPDGNDQLYISLTLGVIYGVGLKL